MNRRLTNLGKHQVTVKWTSLEAQYIKTYQC